MTDCETDLTRLLVEIAHRQSRRACQSSRIGTADAMLRAAKTSKINMRGGCFSADEGSRSARRFWRDCCAKYVIPKVGRDSEIARHRMAMMTKMLEPEAAQPRPFAKLPTVHGIVNQEIRDISGNQAGCGSTGNLGIPKTRETKEEDRKAGDADPNRRSNEVVWMRVVHAMEIPDDGDLMVDETMHQIFDERP